VTQRVHANGYTIDVVVDPNKAAVPNTFTVRITKGGRPVTGADVVDTFAMLDMEMQNQEYRAREAAPGVYTLSRPALVMVGHWGITLSITPRGGSPFDVVLVDRAGG
jgi:uncharacterized GH25 family protein